MALQTLGTSTTIILTALPAWSQVLSAADIAAISAGITDDRQFAAIVSGYSAGPTAMIGTGDTHTNTTLDNVARVSGAALAQIALGDLVLGAGIPKGTFVQAVSGSTVTLSQAATATATVNVAFCRPYRPGLGPYGGELYVPNRGVLKVLPGDIVAVDNTGWPVLVSANAIGYAGSQWVLT